MTNRRKSNSRFARIASSMKSGKGAPTVLRITASALAEELVRLNERVAAVEDLKAKVGELSKAVIALTATVNQHGSDIASQRILAEKLAEGAQRIEELLHA